VKSHPTGIAAAHVSACGAFSAATLAELLPTPIDALRRSEEFTGDYCENGAKKWVCNRLHLERKVEKLNILSLLNLNKLERR
jgi:hypothetical protein